MSFKKLARTTISPDFYDAAAPAFEFEAIQVGDDILLTLDVCPTGTQAKKTYGPIRLVSGWLDVLAATSDVAQAKLDDITKRLAQAADVASLSDAESAARQKLAEIKCKLEPLQAGMSDVDKIQALVDGKRLELDMLKKAQELQAREFEKAQAGFAATIDSCKATLEETKKALAPWTEGVSLVRALEKLRAEIREAEAQKLAALGKPADRTKAEESGDYILERFRRLETE